MSRSESGAPCRISTLSSLSLSLIWEVESFLFPVKSTAEIVGRSSIVTTSVTPAASCSASTESFRAAHVPEGLKVRADLVGVVRVAHFDPQVVGDRVRRDGLVPDDPDSQDALGSRDGSRRTRDGSGRRRDRARRGDRGRRRRSDGSRDRSRRSRFGSNRRRGGRRRRRRGRRRNGLGGERSREKEAAARRPTGAIRPAFRSPLGPFLDRCRKRNPYLKGKGDYSRREAISYLLSAVS